MSESTSSESMQSPSTSSLADAPLFPPTNTAKPLPPPPLPMKPLAFVAPTPAPAPPRIAPEESGNFARLAARLSWIAPIVGSVFGMIGGLLGDQLVGQIIATVGGLFILSGVGFALLALANIRRHGKDGIIVPATIGLTVNLALLLAGAWLTMAFVSAARRPSVAGAAPVGNLMNLPLAPPAPTPPVVGSIASEPTALELAAASSPSSPATAPAPSAPPSTVPPAVSDQRLPGWLGFTDRTDLRIVVLEWHGSDPARQKMHELWGADSTIVRVIINNAVGQSQVTIDPASLEFHFNDYTTLKALPPKEILETAKSDRDYYLKRYGGEWNVPPRAVRNDGLAFFPAGTNLANARAVTMVLNGQRIVVPGKYCSPAEKAELLDQLQIGG